MPAKATEGLTLIEVLIALAIVSIALAAILKTVSQYIQTSTYLKHKTIALWVAKETLNEFEVKLRSMQRHENVMTGKTTMLEKDWFWRVLQLPTLNQHVLKYKIDVYMNDPDINESIPLISLESYQYDDQKE